MHLLLTDRLTCPRCGPDFGLILLASSMRERWVREGVLGCANCRDSFPIVEGFGDLRAPPRRELPTGLAGEPGHGEHHEGTRITALLGVVRGPGTIALVGAPARHAEVLAAGIEDIQIVALDPDLRGWPDDGAFSRLVSGPGLPFFTQMLRGVAVDGRLGVHVVAEAARVVARMSRVVVVHAYEGAGGTLEAQGLTILVSEAETVVAARG